MGNAVRAQDAKGQTVPNLDQGSLRAVTVVDKGQGHQSWCNESTSTDDGCYVEVQDEFDLSQYGARMNWSTNRIHGVNVGSQSAVLEVNQMMVEMVCDPFAAFTILPIKVW